MNDEFNDIISRVRDFSQAYGDTKVGAMCTLIEIVGKVHDRLLDINENLYQIRNGINNLE